MHGLSRLEILNECDREHTSYQKHGKASLQVLFAFRQVPLPGMIERDPKP